MKVLLGRGSWDIENSNGQDSELAFFFNGIPASTPFVVESTGLVHAKIVRAGSHLIDIHLVPSVT